MRYADKLEIYSFTEQEAALDSLESVKIDVLLSNDAFEIDTAGLPKRCGFAYLADSTDIPMINGQKAICKFQKAELIYKQILGIYSEHSSSISNWKSDGASTKAVVFQSVSGGTGASTMAAGQFDMSDIIYALKSKKANLPLRLESCVKQDPRGVYFFAQPKNALDMFELDCNETMRLISVQQAMNLYDYIVIDSDFGMDQDTLRICRRVHWDAPKCS